MKRVLSNATVEQDLSLLIGVSSQLRDYRLVHQINQNKEIPFLFNRHDDMKGASGNDTEPVYFPFYLYRDEEDYYTAYLVSNRHMGQILIAGLKEMDYLILVEGSFGSVQKKALLKALRTEPGVLMASEVNIASLKQFPSFVDDIEFHMMT